MLPGTFDASAALAMMYLWMMFGLISVFLNCDLRRFLQDHGFIRHLLGLIAFFFLFTILDPQNESHVALVFLKTVLVYFLFVLATKSRWYFSGTALAILFADLVIKYHIGYLERQKEHDKLETYKRARQILFIIIVILICMGTVDYIIKQMREQKKFSWKQFLIGTCSSV